ncbi:hypothetical protein D3C85_1801690 [compost metagenome]
MMTVIARVIATIENKPGPKPTINSGPSATFGMLFSTTMYGSSTLARNGTHQINAASSVPASVPSKKPITVSPTVAATCGKRLPSSSFV